MAAPGLCGPRRAPRPLRGGGPALAVAVVGLALGGLGGRSPPTALLRATTVAVTAVPPPRSPCPPPTAPAAAVPAAVPRNGPAQQSHREALRPRHSGLQPEPSLFFRSPPSTVHVPSETTPVPSLAWLLELAGFVTLAAAPGVQSTLLWLGVVLLLLGLLLLAPAFQFWNMGKGGQHANSGRSTRSPTPIWCALATTASSQDHQSPQASPATSLSSADVGGTDSDAPLRMPSTDVQQHLDAFAIDVRKVVRRYRPVAKYDVQRVERITSYLAGLKVDVRRVVEAYPILLTGKVERYEAVVELLRANGVDVVKVVNCNPSVLGHRPDTLRHTMAAIAACGHSVADVVDRQPQTLRSSASDVAAMLQLHRRSVAATLERPASGQPLPSLAGALEAADPRVALLASLGLDADRLLRRAPNVLVYSLDKLQVSVAYLKGLGVDTARVVWRAPTVLSFLPETMQRRVQFLAENGLDVVRHINGRPHVLYSSVERKLRPTLTFVVEEMKRSTAELDAAYNLWGYSLEDRLRPRFQYLQSLGLSRPSLVSFGIFPDARFASRLAGTDLQHYYAWRLRNGYAVPALPTDADPSGPEEELAHSPSVGTAVSPEPPPSETEAPPTVQS